jgi:GTP-binding protein HflX
MDMYEKNIFDEWLEPEVKENLLNELKKRWENETNSSCVFISAIERRDINHFRATLLNLVRNMYTKRYPFKTGFGFQYDAF